jgi:hypothetical protein
MNYEEDKIERRQHGQPPQPVRPPVPAFNRGSEGGVVLLKGRYWDIIAVSSLCPRDPDRKTAAYPMFHFGHGIPGIAYLAGKMTVVEPEPELRVAALAGIEERKDVVVDFNYKEIDALVAEAVGKEPGNIRTECLRIDHHLSAGHGRLRVRAGF